MRLDTIARIIEASPRLTEQYGDGWTQRHWHNRRNGKYYTVEYMTTEHEDAVCVRIHRNGKPYLEKGG